MTNLFVVQNIDQGAFSITKLLNKIIVCFMFCYLIYVSITI